MQVPPKLVPTTVLLSSPAPLSVFRFRLPPTSRLVATTAVVPVEYSIVVVSGNLTDSLRIYLCTNSLRVINLINGMDFK